MTDPDAPNSMPAEALSQLYGARFAGSEHEGRRRLWQCLVRNFFRRHIPPTARVLDVACGFGEFINAVEAAERTAIDLNPDAGRHLEAGVRFIHDDIRALRRMPAAAFDIIFCSNFLEHLPDHAAVEDTVRQFRRLLAPGGRLILMGPNARLIPGAYWDFWDHRVPITDRSLGELLRANGFAIETMVARFLPYTTRSILPSWPVFVRLYLWLRPLWFLLGKQFLAIATPERLSTPQ